jgi:hypothetical protein
MLNEFIKQFIKERKSSPLEQKAAELLVFKEEKDPYEDEICEKEEEKNPYEQADEIAEKQKEKLDFSLIMQEKELNNDH